MCDAIHNDQEVALWLEPDTDHGHFHAGEDIVVKVCRGYNMKPNLNQSYKGLEAFAVNNGERCFVPINEHNGKLELNLGKEQEGFFQICVQELVGAHNYYGKIIFGIGHYNNKELQPVGLPFEIMPTGNVHARIGSRYEVQVLKAGQPFAGAEARITYTNAANPDYPHRLTSNADGKIQIFMSAPGNYLFFVKDGNTICTLTVVKDH